ncbi:MAG: DivIVA domain-containing protein [Oscillospiraceae bacterium]|nr:DivIVA domain-containing protein [Oscillospiraceae bacterium]
MSNRFKSALFSGFNRRDVVSYITDQAKQKEALSDQAAGLEAQLEEVRQALADAQKENETLRAELAEARQRAAAAEETCRGMQQAVRSSLAELNALSGTFDGRTKEVPGEDAELPEPEEETELFEEPRFPEDDTPADPVPAEDAAPEAEEDVCEQPGDDTPAEDVPEEPAASAAEGAPTKRRIVEIRRHERI